MDDIAAAEGRPERTRVIEQADDRPGAAGLRDPGRRIGNVGADDFDGEALLAEEFGELPRLIGHPAFGRRQRADETDLGHCPSSTPIAAAWPRVRPGGGKR